MGLVSQRIERNEIAVGDHIYTWRTLYAYTHHGIYVGENRVVHFTQMIGSSEDSSVTSSGSTPASLFNFCASNSNVLPTTCPNISDCGARQVGSGVIRSCLDCFLSTGSLYRFEYGVSKVTYIAKFRGGTCTMAKSDPPQEVIHRALYLLHNGFGNYDAFRNNCEDFALYCKTGLLVDNQRGRGSSGQAACASGAPVLAAGILSATRKLVSIPVAAVGGAPVLATGILSSTLKLVSSPVVAVTTAAGTYCMNRYASDIGVRTDVVKVKVEDMVVLRGRD